MQGNRARPSSASNQAQAGRSRDESSGGAGGGDDDDDDAETRNFRARGSSNSSSNSGGGGGGFGKSHSSPRFGSPGGASHASVGSTSSSGSAKRLPNLPTKPLTPAPPSGPRPPASPAQARRFITATGASGRTGASQAHATWTLHGQQHKQDQSTSSSLSSSSSSSSSSPASVSTSSSAALTSSSAFSSASRSPSRPSRARPLAAWLEVETSNPHAVRDRPKSPRPNLDANSPHRARAHDTSEGERSLAREPPTPASSTTSVKQHRKPRGLASTLDPTELLRMTWPPSMHDQHRVLALAPLQDLRPSSSAAVPEPEITAAAAATATTSTSTSTSTAVNETAQGARMGLGGPAQPSATSRTVIDNLRLLAVIGEGAFGRVFLTERRNPKDSFEGNTSASATTPRRNQTSPAHSDQIAHHPTAHGSAVGTRERSRHHDQQDFSSSSSSSSPPLITTLSGSEQSGATGATAAPRCSSRSSTASPAHSRPRLCEDVADGRPETNSSSSRHASAVDEVASLSLGPANAAPQRFFAVKVMQKSNLRTEALQRQACMEVQVLRTVGNFPFIATFVFACQTSTRLYVGMEFCAAGDFFSYMSQSHIRHDDIPLYVGEIALALDHLHSHGILFRDLKPENITLSARGHVRLIDFGLSVFLDSEEAQTSANGRREVVTSCGTLTYTAPEVLCRTPHSYESDWWSLGILAYELYTGFMPFEGANDQETCDLICTVDFEPCPPVVEGRPEYDLIRRLLVRAQDLRLGYRRSDVRIVLSHAVFAGIDWDDLLHERISPHHPFGNQSSLSLAHFGDEFTTQTPIDRPLAPASAPQHVFDTELYPVITDTQLRSTR